MNSARLKKLYEKIPESFKLVFSPLIRRGLIGNRIFLEQYKELETAETMDADALLELQFNKLKELCVFAYENTMYYRDVFDKVHFDPYNFKTIQEFTSKVPVLTKDTVLEHYDEINVQNITGDYPASTGGSTGKRLVVNNSQECFYKENAFACHHYKKIGYDYKKSKVAYVGGLGKTLVSASPLYNMMRYNSKLINKDTVQDVIKSMNKFRPNYIQGLPSAIYFLCRLIRESNEKLSFTLDGVIFASENIYPEQRKFVEETFGCKALAHYGQTERVNFAEEIIGSSDIPEYWFNPLYGLTEIDSSDGNTIIGTGFINKKMPLLRYKNDDVAELVRSTEIGNVYHIEGHRTAAMIGKNGERISPASFAHMESLLDLADKFQFVQNIPGEITVNLIPKRTLSNEELEKIREEFERMFMGKMKVFVETVEHVEVTARGKFALLIQHIQD